MLEERYLERKVQLNELLDSSTVGKDHSLQVVNEMVDYLTLALAGICTVLNSATVILAGDISQSARLLADCLRERLKGKLPLVPQIVISQLGHRAVAFGAITMVLDATTLNVAVPGV
jgi:predicted NBD/HSP70 family sugar kinase